MPEHECDIDLLVENPNSGYRWEETMWRGWDVPSRRPQPRFPQKPKKRGR